MKSFVLFLFFLSNNLFSQCEVINSEIYFEQFASLIKPNSYVVKYYDQSRRIRKFIKPFRKNYYIPKGRYKYFKNYNKFYDYLETKKFNLISYDNFDSLGVYEGGKVSYRFGDIVYNKKNRFYVFNVLVFVSRTVGSNIYYTLQCKNGEMILTRLYSHGIG
jgi:hypothetical protein